MTITPTQSSNGNGNGSVVDYPTALSVRQAARTGLFSSPTTGLCPSQVQANLLILPAKYASDFRGLCKRNPVSCPLLGENRAPGDWRLQERLAEDSDIRKDSPGYNVYLNGKLIKHDVPSVEEYWKDDSVAFLIGCSFTFEQALADAGLAPRHQEVGRNVPMYRTNLPLLPSGIFHGNTVVSMRPYRAEDIERVRDITRPYLETHGEPIAWGEDATRRLGIADIDSPEFGDPPVIRDGEVPVYWGCGVTTQLVVMSSPECQGISIGHAPGKMVCLDLSFTDIMTA